MADVRLLFLSQEPRGKISTQPDTLIMYTVHFILNFIHACRFRKKVSMIVVHVCMYVWGWAEIFPKPVERVSEARKMITAIHKKAFSNTPVHLGV